MKGPVIVPIEEEFSEYMWMGEELEEFDNKIKSEVIQCEDEFWEEYFIEMCFEEMLDEEDDEWFYPVLDLDIATLVKLQLRLENKSSLNPLAPEFYPRSYSRSYSTSSEDDLAGPEDECQQR